MRKLYKKHITLFVSLILLLITVLIDEVLFSDAKRRVDPQETITKNVQNELEVLNGLINQVADVAIVDLSRLFNRLPQSEELPYFLFEDGEVIFWSTHRFVPKYGTLSGTYLYRYLSLPSGNYLVKRKVINSAQNRVVEIFALLPLSSVVPLNSSYEEYGLNGKIFSKSNFNLFEESAKGRKDVYAKEGVQLFSFTGTNQMKVDYPGYSIFVLVLYTSLICTFIWSGYTYAHEMADKGSGILAIALLGCFILLPRLLMLFYQFPHSVLEIPLFDPDIFAQSWWQPSIGDFMINQLGVLGLSAFAFKIFTRKQKQREEPNFWAMIISFLLLLGTVFYLMANVNSLLRNAQWSFDIATSIDFGTYKVLAYLSIFVISMVPFMVTQYLSVELGMWRFRLWVNLFLLITFALTLSLYIFFGSPFFLFTCLLMAYLFLVYQLRLAPQLYQNSYGTFLYLFTTALLLATFCTLWLNAHLENERISQKKSIVTEIQSDNDVTAEFLLFQAHEKIASDILIQTNITNPFTSKDLIKEKIRRVYLGDYFDKYEIEILIFNGKGAAINSSTSANYEDLRATYAVNENQTDFADLYFYRTPYPNFQNQYYLFNEIQRYGNTIGYVLVKLNRKEILNNSILPQLLLHEGSKNVLRDLDYAVYQNNQLFTSRGEYNYSQSFDMAWLDEPMLYKKGLSTAMYHHLGVKNTQTDEVYIISSQKYPLRYVITNFSVFFLFMVGVIIVIFGVSAAYNNLRKQSVSLASKIQILLNFAFFLPLITVSIVVLSLVNRTVEENIEAQYLDIAKSASENIQRQMTTFIADRNENTESLESSISEISQYARADINLFNNNGRLMATNQRLIFENDLLAPFVNPKAMAAIKEGGQKESLEVETVGRLNYKSTYYGIRNDDNNQLIGILSMPFFDSAEQLKIEQREILSNILNSFTFIFVIFVVLSFFASRVLTYPIKYLTDKIKMTTLTNLNEPLEWNADDEIGLMVREYNTMLAKLEKSKKELAMTEKENAWREMAQQVAHEIKNPLTPMKLKLQHMRRTLSMLPIESKDYEKPIDNLLSQVETLSDIATSFSSFAKMPIPESKRLDLIKELKRSVRLFKEDEIDIIMDVPKDPIWILGDQQLLGRIFNNLILNAEQSVDSEVSPKLHVVIELGKRKVLISFHDNGVGIDQSIRDKIFVPKFSTKAEGSGIGLAIAKRGVEHAGGSIWFESSGGKGTTFYIEFPLIE